MQVETNDNVVNRSVSGALVVVCLAIAGCGGSGSSGGVGGVGGGQGHGSSGGGAGDLSPGPNERASLFAADTEADGQSQKPAVPTHWLAPLCMLSEPGLVN